MQCLSYLKLAPDVAEAKRLIVSNLPKDDKGIAAGKKQFQQGDFVLDDNFIKLLFMFITWNGAKKNLQ